MDSVLDIKNIPILESTLVDSDLRKDIRLLCVFGCNGEEVIFATNDDNVYGFGRNRFSGLGLGTDKDGIKEPQINTTLSRKNVTDICCGYEHWMALTADGFCYSWGHNQFGQLGIGSVASTSTPHLIQTLAKKQVIQLSCGASHSLALTTDGQVYSWGSNKSGQLGNGTQGSHHCPKQMPFDEEVIDISCGKNHSIALTISGQVFVWGINNYGQLGVELRAGFIAYRPVQVFISESTIFTKVICGPNYSLLLSSDGYVYAFGENSCGQIGNGSTDNQMTPFKVNDDIQFTDIITHKENDVSIGVSADDKYYVWGLAKNRRIMRPKEITDITLKSTFDIYAKYAKTKLIFKTIVINNDLNSCQAINRNLDNFKKISSNKLVFPSEKSSEKVLNKPMSSRNTQTLDDVLDSKSFPILYTTLNEPKVRNSIRLLRVFGIKGCKVIFATNSDKVYGFGLNRDGSLGLDIHEIKIRRPVLNEVLSGKQLIDIAPGFEHCLGLTADGLIYGWGQNRYGQVGNGKTENQFTPQLVKDLSDLKVIQIKCGAYFSLALTEDGELFSWGHNTFAQLGDRTYNSRDIPTQVFISEKVISISCGTNHTMALAESGRVYIWGNNTTGQLGRSPDMDIQKSREKPMSNRPRVLEGFQNVEKAICGQNHSLILTTDGSLYSFGGNDNGQVGNGTTKDQFTPFQLNNNEKIKIKDIVSNFDVDFTIAVSEDNECYVWGLVKYEKLLRPKVIHESHKRLFDIYGLYSANKTMFRTLIVNTLEQIRDFELPSQEPEDLSPDGEEFYNLFPQNLYNFSTNELMIRKEMINTREVKSFDEELDLNLFPILSSTLKDKNVRKCIRLLYVFGKKATNVIFATKEDKVYAFGDNSDGFLGLGTYELNIKSPTLNEPLSYNQLIDIQSGFKHCLALTASGQCYSWGQNRYGQLGVGSFHAFNYPKLIDSIKDKRVIQICCGANHSMVLTIDGQLYSWGLNILGQLGSSNYLNYSTPTHIEVKHPIVSISCGLNHSSAVDNIGMSYAWGHNKYGQLGRERERDYRPERKEWIANRPGSNLYFKNITFIKSCCGPNHTLFLTNDGYIYAFGDNTNGQVGNGKVGQQFRPIRINEEIRFKDIITHFENDLSIAVSTDGRHYVWGFVDERKVLSPRLIPKTSKSSVFNIYAKYASIKITFKTIIFNETKALNQSVDDCSYDQNCNIEEISVANRSSDSTEDLLNACYQSSHSMSCASEQSTAFDTSSVRSSIQNSKPSTTFQNRLNQCFDNPINSDLRVISEDKIIYCHKTIIQIRNQKFWQILSQQLNEDKDEIKINIEKFELFYAFLQYLYGIEPEVNERIISDLQAMAEHFEETDLLDECYKYIKDVENTPNLSNICTLYEKAINEQNIVLENKCIEFAAKDWKSIINSEGFQTLSDSLSKRLMFAALTSK